MRETGKPQEVGAQAGGGGGGPYLESPWPWTAEALPAPRPHITKPPPFAGKRWSEPFFINPNSDAYGVLRCIGRPTWSE